MQPKAILSNPSKLEKLSEKVQARYRQVRELYCQDDYPWIVGYSGGKDSTATLQLIFYALMELKRGTAKKPVFVISSDTLVENPSVADQINGSLERINRAAKDLSLPITAHLVTPKITETFWVQLIGKGYPSPQQKFRWCTEKLKIKPADAFITQLAGRQGKAIVVLGTRMGESASRDQVLKARRVEGTPLCNHTTLPNTLVYPPVIDFDLDDIWTYLLNKTNPWGDDNHELAKLYNHAQSGECPLVVDKTTPSCGNSRFGCWVCTVVEKDRAMEGMIEDGEKWLEGMLRFRQNLKEYRKNREMRSVKRRDGKIYQISRIIKGERTETGISGRGPFTLEARAKILRELLLLEKDLQKARPGIQLISEQELHEIRHNWFLDLDYEDPLPKIYQEITGKELDWMEDERPLFSLRENQILNEVCGKHEISPDLLRKLMNNARENQGMTQRSGITAKIEKILSEDWPTEHDLDKIAKSDLEAMAKAEQ